MWPQASHEEEDDEEEEAEPARRVSEKDKGFWLRKLVRHPFPATVPADSLCNACLLLEICWFSLRIEGSGSDCCFPFFFLKCSSHR